MMSKTQARFISPDTTRTGTPGLASGLFEPYLTLLFYGERVPYTPGEIMEEENDCAAVNKGKRLG